MIRSKPRLYYATLAFSLILFTGLTAARAQTQQTTEEHSFDIPAQDLGKALTELGQQAEREIVFSAEATRGKRSVPLQGTFTLKQALDKLLTGTGLSYRLTPSGPVAIEASPNTTANNGSGSSTAGVSLAESPASPKINGLEEIVVTAQKKAERLQDVPIPVTVLNAQLLADNNQLLLQDYYSSVPGLSLEPGPQSSQIISIRGISQGSGSNPTVGVTVDDVPYGSSTEAGGGLVVPDIDPGDLARIEVLRGPQGALYGANSMGGLLKYVTVDPSTDGLSGRVQAGVSSTYNGAEPGYNVRASINVPLSDTLAIRASAFKRQDAGYIDNPVLEEKGVNEAEAAGGRLSALWRPSNVVTFKVSALYQSIKGNGLSDVDVPTGGYPQTGLQQNYIPNVGGYDRTLQAYSATLNAKLGSIDLTAVSGYNINRAAESQDFSYALGSSIQNGVPNTGFNGFGVSGAPIFTTNKTDKLTQEVRITAPIGQSLEWLTGAFYSHENSELYQSLPAENATTGEIVGQFGNTSFPSTYEEYAAFTNLTYHVTDQLDIQVGGREGQFRAGLSSTFAGPYAPAFLGPPSPVIYPEVDSKDNAFTYLLTPQFKVTSDLMVYARLASGFRPGGPNGSPGAPTQYSPDKTENYELGIKGDFIDHTLSIDASLYYIDWKNIQIVVLTPTFVGYTTNGSGAKSEGIEFSIESRPLNGLTIAAWAAYDNAVLTQAFPPPCGSTSPPGPCSSVYGVPGNRLPFSSRFSGNLSLKQEFPLVDNVTGFVAGTASYVGSREGDFNSPPPSPPPRQFYPAYTKTDLRAGIRYDSWVANFFVNNVADVRGLIGGGIGYPPPYAFIYTQPRTVGISVSRDF